MTLPTLPTSDYSVAYDAAWNRAADHVVTDSGNAITNGTALDAALTVAAAGNANGDYILELPAGASFTHTVAGNNTSASFVMPNSTGNHWIVIRTSHYNTGLPSSGTRVAPADKSNMARLYTDSISPVASCAASAHKIRFIGIEFENTNATAGVTVTAVCLMGSSTTNTAIDKITFDRCYVHGNPLGSIQDGIQFVGGTSMGVVDSYIADLQAYGSEGHGIWLNVALGPLLIQNNYISASSINLFTGGNGAQAILTYDLTIRGNYIFKPLSWQSPTASGPFAGQTPNVKNLQEFKIVERVLCEGNVYENHWQAQQTAAISFSSRDPSGHINDVTFRLNVLKNCTWFVWKMTTGDTEGYGSMNRVLIENNLVPGFGDRIFDSIGNSTYGGSIKDLTIQHNTCISNGTGNGSLYLFENISDPAIDGFTFYNNIVSRGYGFKYVGSPASLGDGIASFKDLTRPNAGGTVQDIVANYDVNNNVTIDNKSNGTYSTNATFRNFFNVANVTAVGFTVNPPVAIADYKLSGASTYRAAGAHPATDATDMGCDITALQTALAGAPPPGVAPVFASGTSITVVEQTTAVGTVVATGDPTMAYTITGGADQAKFALNSSSGALTFSVAPEVETPTDADLDNVYVVAVTATNGVGSASQTISVTVTGVRIISAAAFTMPENSTIVGSVSASGLSSPTFSISGGDAARLAINATTGELSFVVAPDYETPTDGNTDNVYGTTVTATVGTSTDAQAITVTVTDVFEPTKMIVKSLSTGSFFIGCR